MKNIGFTIVFVGLAMSLASCGKDTDGKEEAIPGVIPPDVASLIIGDSFIKDTLYASEETNYIYIDNPDFSQHIIYGPEGVILNSPSVYLDSVSPHRFVVNNLLGSLNVDFAQPVSVAALVAENPQYSGFENIVVWGRNASGQNANYSLTIDVPTPKYAFSDSIIRWLKVCVDSTMSTVPTLSQIGVNLKKAFFGLYKKKESQFAYSDSRSILVYEVTDDYITWQDWFYGFRGGAHGISANRFITFDRKRCAPVKFETHFKPGCEDAVRELIYEALAADEDFMAKARLTSLSQVKTYVSNNLDGESLPIPNPGLLRIGVVFSYQPYDIGPYSDGAFQLVIPYDRIREYMK